MDLRVYTLYRVSTVGQVEKDDIPMQKQCCREFAQRQGWLILEEFSEKGISGYKKSAKDRDAIQQIQQAAVQKNLWWNGSASRAFRSGASWRVNSVLTAM